MKGKQTIDHFCIVRWFAWIAIIATTGFFVVMEVGVGRRQQFETDFVSRDRSFSRLGPPARILSVDPVQGVTTVVGEPVYFDIRIPALTEQADVFVSWRKDSGLPDPKLGVSLGGTAYSPLFSLHPLTVIGGENRFTLSRVTIDLRGVPRRDGAIRLFFSIPGTSAESEFRLHRVRVETIRPSVKLLVFRLWTSFLKRVYSI